jgi:hypothetical protein
VELIGPDSHHAPTSYINGATITLMSRYNIKHRLDRRVLVTSLSNLYERQDAELLDCVSLDRSRLHSIEARERQIQYREEQQFHAHKVRVHCVVPPAQSYRFQALHTAISGRYPPNYFQPSCRINGRSI